VVAGPAAAERESLSALPPVRRTLSKTTRHQSVVGKSVQRQPHRPLGTTPTAFDRPSWEAVLGTRLRPLAVGCDGSFVLLCRDVNGHACITSVARCSELQELGQLGDRSREAARPRGRFERFSLPGRRPKKWDGCVAWMAGRVLSRCGSLLHHFCRSLPPAERRRRPRKTALHCGRLACWPRGRATRCATIFSPRLLVPPSASC
jgi:hypothetical protein